MTMSDQKPIVIFVLGPPGSGKGTQCAKIVEKYGFVHISAGDLLRAEQETPGSEFQELIKGHIRNGTIVPGEITCRLLERTMKSSGKGRFLIDGFPRSQDNVEIWRSYMSDKVNELFVLCLDCTEEIAVKRCLERGLKGSGRADDNVESLKKRFQTLEKCTSLIIKDYESRNLVRRVDANRTDVDAIFSDICKIFDDLKLT